MKINILKYENDKGEKRIKIMFEHHRTVIFTSEIDEKEENHLHAKLKIVDEYLNTFDPIYTKKEILKTWAKIDEQIKVIYKQNFDNRGGSREGSGRKAGSKKTTPKSDRTARFTMAITESEKEYLIDQLERYRRRHALIDKL